MELGLCTFATEASIRPQTLAIEAEQRGFASLWFTDHSHIPLSRTTPWPGGDELPRHYCELFDPLVAMTAAAGATTSLRVGVGVAILVQRDPIQLAKEIATLDVISGGRVDVGVGGGWNIEEMMNHGTDPATRWRLLRERVEAMKAIWTMDAAEYHGELVDFDPIASFPKPVQEPHPPIHVGVGTRRGCDGPSGTATAGSRSSDGATPISGRSPTSSVAKPRRRAATLPRCSSRSSASRRRRVRSRPTQGVRSRACCSWSVPRRVTTRSARWIAWPASSARTSRRLRREVAVANGDAQCVSRPGTRNTRSCIASRL